MYGVKEIDPREFDQWQRGGRRFLLIDVRSPSETARGVIQGAELIPLHLLPMNVDLLAQTTNDDEQLLLYCRIGARSFQACAFLMQRGLQNVYNLRGGIIEWMSIGNTLSAPETKHLFAS